MAKNKNNNDDLKIEQLRQEFNETVEELKTEIAELRKELVSLRGQLRQVERESSANQKTAMVVWEKASGTLGDITKKISDIAKPLNTKGYRRDT